ncbi:putative pre-mRNA splicing factor [Leishmania major strain Friedlin]|uniref:RNA helicase n=1 Tax=Leishmania major TaxID=5664 RepID=Q4QAM3_LEIMA|nr:putative pre-mRNA splicing factor [Leishmania major strain Friedlin]CAG9574577.1 pre-mRNA-splicing_factor_ATP-dependent_RNA_helicase_-_putative [Leishmania major strain Friedlin]CAJ04757.1 putative pre-mRNA splicing factor [Leishmania major strain Friedlin]|eukprot:XP_001683625.1 putative pre-mRNA splicing factor [Leishmania major strain Friedlin]
MEKHGKLTPTSLPGVESAVTRTDRQAQRRIIDGEDAKRARPLQRAPAHTHHAMDAVPGDHGIKRPREAITPRHTSPFVSANDVTASLQEQAQRFISQLEMGEVLEHDRDTTEAVMTGTDESAQWAYGSEYYLRHDGEDDKEHPSRSHTVGSTAAAAAAQESASDAQADKARKVVVSLTVAPPSFFTSGNDFETSVLSRRSAAAAHKDDNDDGGDLDRRDGFATSRFLHEALRTSDVDIIVPVVSHSCSLAVSASKGSQTLAELKRLMDRERTNRDVMDTSKSSLTQLLQKDTYGRVVNGEEKEVEGVGGGSAPGHAHSGRVSSFADDRCNDDGEEEEAKYLKRQLCLEKERLAEMTQLRGTLDASSTASPPAAGGANSQWGSNQESRRQRKDEQLARIEGRKAQMETLADDADEVERRDAMRRQRESLPIHHCKDELLRYVGESAVTVVVGETGSGKTTQLVQYLYQRGYARHGKIIGCTQPRRLAAIGVARRVSDEMGCALGTTVGYSIHLDDTTTADTRVKFMTDGVLLRETVNDPSLDKYSVVMLDEAHERSVDTDVLMGVLKLALRRRGDLKLIVTSATMDVRKFSAFFGNAPCYEIPGQTFPVKIHYSATPVADYVAEAVFRVCQLHLQMPLEAKHDILVFMTGREDVYGTCELIRRRLTELSPQHLSTLLIISCLSEAAPARSTEIGVLEATPAGLRKVVVATNVAETSLTIDGVRYVVDCGFMKTNVYRPSIGMNTLQRYPTSQAQANQRKGRAGRTTEGTCYRLYTEVQYAEEMLPNSVPEIQRSSVDSVVLLLKSIGVHRLRDFEFMDAPPAANVRSSMFHLWVLGFLDDAGAITAPGQQALEFPMSPVLAKLLLESATMGCALEMARIVAMISADPKNLFELPKGREKVAQQHHSRFYANDSDHLTLLHVFTQYLDHGRSRQWAQDHFLHAPTLARAHDVFAQLIEKLRKLHLPIQSCGHAETDKVRHCLAKAFVLQAARRSDRRWTEYRPLLNAGVACAVHPASAVHARSEMPPYIIYNDLLLTHKEYLVMVTAVEPEWLVESSRGIYEMRHGMTSSSTTTAPSSFAVAAATTPTPSTASRASHASMSSSPTAPSASGSSTTVCAEAKAPTKKPAFGMLSSKRRPNI